MVTFPSLMQNLPFSFLSLPERWHCRPGPPRPAPSNAWYAANMIFPGKLSEASKRRRQQLRGQVGGENWPGKVARREKKQKIGYSSPVAEADSTQSGPAMQFARRNAKVKHWASCSSIRQMSHTSYNTSTRSFPSAAFLSLSSWFTSVMQEK